MPAGRRASLDPLTVTAEEIATFGQAGRQRSAVAEVEDEPADLSTKCPPANAAPELQHQSVESRHRGSHASLGEIPEEDSAEQLEKVKAYYSVFTMLDKDGDGALTPIELSMAMRTFGLHFSMEYLQDLMTELDLDGSGTIDFKEFLHLMNTRAGLEQGTDEERAEDYAFAFRLFDQDGDGLITTDQFRAVMEKLGEPLTAEEAHEIMSAVDTDGDGQIDLVDFFRLMQAK